MTQIAVIAAFGKLDEEQRKVTGWASVVTKEDGSRVIDSQEDIIPIEEIEKAAHELMLAGGTLGEMHARLGVGRICESFVASVEKRKALGLGDGPEGWVITAKVTDDAAWARVKKGELAEFSIGGTAERVEKARTLRNLRLTEVSLVDKGANPGAKIVLVKRDSTLKEGQVANNGEVKKMNLDEVLASLPEDKKAVIMQALADAKTAAKAEEPKKDETPAEMAKRDGLSEDVRKALEKAAADSERITKLEQDKRDREYFAKASSLGVMPKLPVEKLAKVLMAADDKLEKADADMLRDHFKSVAELVKSSKAFSETGTAGEGAGDSALAQIESLAKEMVAKDKSLSIQKAKLLVSEQNPELYKRARAESQGAR